MLSDMYYSAKSIVVARVDAILVTTPELTFSVGVSTATEFANGLCAI